MSGGSHFLSRWSRLKRQADEKRPPPESGSPSSSEGGSDLPAGAVSMDHSAEIGPDLTPEELAALPRLEDLTPNMDLAPFMRAGVPASLRNAALRRMWTLDPAIRDRVGDALEYAYDWNVAGGVPGSGQLLAVDDVASMLRSIAGEPPQREIMEPAPEQAPNQLAELSPPLEQPAEPSPGEPLTLAERQPTRTQANDAPALPAPDPEKAPAGTRRHGGATPF